MKDSTIVVVCLIVAAVVGGLIFAIYANTQHNRDVRQEKYNKCLDTGGSPIVVRGDQTICFK